MYIHIYIFKVVQFTSKHYMSRFHWIEAAYLRKFKHMSKYLQDLIFQKIF